MRGKVISVFKELTSDNWPWSHLPEAVDLSPCFHGGPINMLVWHWPQDHSSLCTGLALNFYTLGQICKSWFLWYGTVPQPSASFGFKHRNETRGVYLKYESTINTHFEKTLLRQGAESRLICALLIPSGCEWAGRPQYCLFVRPIAHPCAWLDILLLSATSQSRAAQQWLAIPLTARKDSSHAFHVHWLECAAHGCEAGTIEIYNVGLI